jgi:RimJ/RimL family protein N-acetyltransferase
MAVSFDARPDVTLVPLTAAHAPRMAAWMTDPEIAANVGLRREPSLARTEAWISAAAADPTSVRPFAILAGGVHVGNVVLDRFDAYLGTARLSIYVGDPAARGAGIGRTAVFRALEEAFGPLRLHKVWLTVHAQNHAAIRTYAALGFSTEGVLRDEFRRGDERLDALYMGILARELAAPGQVRGA